MRTTTEGRGRSAIGTARASSTTAAVLAVTTLVGAAPASAETRTGPDPARVGIATSRTAGAGTPVDGSTRATSTPRCSATGIPTTTRFLRQLPKVPQAKAIAILRAASSCNSAALVAIARRDKTRLSFGMPDPRTELAVPDADGRYRALVIMFTRMKPTVTKNGRSVSYVWPLVHVRPTAAAWRQVVTSGLMTQKEVNAMRREVGAYWGWRTSIGAKGAWEFDVAGD